MNAQPPLSGLRAVGNLDESRTASQHSAYQTTSQHNDHLALNQSGATKTSVSQYLSERGDKTTAEKKVYRLILRSEENNGAKLKAALESDLAQLDLTSLVDRQGHTPLSFACYKEKAAAARVLLEYVQATEGGSKVLGTGSMVLD